MKKYLQLPGIVILFFGFIFVSQTKAQTISPRPAVCTSSTISSNIVNRGRAITITLNGTPPAGTYITRSLLAFYNRDNQNTYGSFKPVQFQAGSHYIMRLPNPSSNNTSATFTINYDQINQPDLNWNGQYPVNFAVNGYFRLSNGSISAANSKCVKWFSKTPPVNPTSIITRYPTSPLYATRTPYPTRPPITPFRSPTPYITRYITRVPTYYPTITPYKTPNPSDMPYISCSRLTIYVNGLPQSSTTLVKVGDKVHFVAYGTANGKIIRFVRFKLIHKESGKIVFTQDVPVFPPRLPLGELPTYEGYYVATSTPTIITLTGTYQVSAQMLGDNYITQ